MISIPLTAIVFVCPFIMGQYTEPLQPGTTFSLFLGSVGMICYRRGERQMEQENELFAASLEKSLLAEKSNGHVDISNGAVEKKQNSQPQVQVQPEQKIFVADRIKPVEIFENGHDSHSNTNSREGSKRQVVHHNSISAPRNPEPSLSSRTIQSSRI